jgi:hypothetical protein
MKIGTKSVLFGAHCFLIHPVIIMIAWIKLYGFPWDPRLWIAFFVHDLGYIGKPNMDGKEGETHPELGAKIMSVFGKEWADFTRDHSRFYAEARGVNYSRLCVADKLAIGLEPSWLYLPRVILTGEISEYVEKSGKNFVTLEEWHKWVRSHLTDWAFKNKECKEDKIKIFTF